MYSLIIFTKKKNFQANFFFYYFKKSRMRGKKNKQTNIVEITQKELICLNVTKICKFNKIIFCIKNKKTITMTKNSYYYTWFN